jgi:signal peptidase I
MSDTRDTNYDPFNVTPPEAFDPPERTASPDTFTAPSQYEAPPSYVAPESYVASDPFASPEPLVAGEPMAFSTEPVPLHASEPMPLVGTEPLPVMAGGIAGTPDTRMAIDGGSLRMGRIVEEMLAWLKTLASAAVYATLIVTFGFQVARVEGQSMAPTLADQDRLIVNKLAYRLDKPKVDDIVMLYYPLKPEKSFVKRVIAEEGDQVRIVDGKVYRNDVLMDDSFVPIEFRSHDDWGPQVIPEGYYFVMGDHRNNSSDSRHWGFVPTKYIIGKVQLRWWPLSNARMF